jgi:hypothetical protein
MALHVVRGAFRGRADGWSRFSVPPVAPGRFTPAKPEALPGTPRRRQGSLWASTSHPTSQVRRGPRGAALRSPSSLGGAVPCSLRSGRGAGGGAPTPAGGGPPSGVSAVVTVSLASAHWRAPTLSPASTGVKARSHRLRWRQRLHSERRVKPAIVAGMTESACFPGRTPDFFRRTLAPPHAPTTRPPSRPSHRSSWPARPSTSACRPRPTGAHRPLTSNRP